MSDVSLERADALLALGPAELEAALDELVAAGAEAVSLLQELEQQAGDKRTRKVVRRALHQLRSRGVEVTASSEATKGGVLRQVAAPEEEALVTSLDPLGRRALFLQVPIKGGATLFEVAVSDEEGVVGLRRHSVRRREGRAFLRSVRGQPGARTLTLPGEQLRALVRRALETGHEPPRGVDRSALEEIASGAGAHTPAEQLRSERQGSEPPAAAEVDTWVRAAIEGGRLSPWPLLGEGVLELARELAQIDDSPLVLSDVQKRERRSEQIAEAARGLLDEARRTLLAARLDDTAVFFAAEGDEEGTAALLALAGRVREAVEPLAVDFLARSLDLSLEIAQRQLKEEDSDKLTVPG